MHRKVQHNLSNQLGRAEGQEMLSLKGGKRGDHWPPKQPFPWLCTGSIPFPITAVGMLRAVETIGIVVIFCLAGMGLTMLNKVTESR